MPVARQHLPFLFSISWQQSCQWQSRLILLFCTHFDYHICVIAAALCQWPTAHHFRFPSADGVIQPPSPLMVGPLRPGTLCFCSVCCRHTKMSVGCVLLLWANLPSKEVCGSQLPIGLHLIHRKWLRKCRWNYVVPDNQVAQSCLSIHRLYEFFRLVAQFWFMEGRKFIRVIRESVSHLSLLKWAEGSTLVILKLSCSLLHLSL